MKTKLELIREIYQATQEHIQADEERIQLFSKICATLKPFDGKQNNKRLATALSKAFDDCCADYEKCKYFGGRNVRLWSGSTGRGRHDCSIYLDLGKADEFCFDDFLKLNPHFDPSQLQKRIDKNEAFLQGDEPRLMAQAMVDLQEAKERLSQYGIGGDKRLPCNWEIEQVTGIKLG